jgi:hypothetical protein
MRVTAVLAMGLVALAACSKKEDKAATAEGSGASASASAPAGPVTLPKRKPGLWTHTINAEGATQTMKLCIDADTDAKMTVWGQAASKEMCARNVVTAAPGGYAFESECDMGQMGKTSGKGTVTGDFNSAYVVKTTSTTTGSSMPQANKTSEMTLTAKWEGACPAGMKGGDMRMTMPGGREMTMNIEQMTAAAGGGQK